MLGSFRLLFTSRDDATERQQGKKAADSAGMHWSQESGMLEKNGLSGGTMAARRGHGALSKFKQTAIALKTNKAARLWTRTEERV